MENILINNGIGGISGGRPVTNNDLNFLMTAIQNYNRFSCQQQFAYILWGCNLSGTTISEGVILDPYSSNLYYHHQTNYPGFVASAYLPDYLDQQIYPRTYADGYTYNCLETKYAYFTESPVNWVSGGTLTYDIMNKQRLDGVLYQLLINNLNFNNGDIWSDYNINGNIYPLQLNSIYGKTNNTIINRYTGNVSIGSANTITGTTANQLLNIGSEMTHLSSTMNTLYSGAFNGTGGVIWAGTSTDGTLASAAYDRILYIYQAPSGSFTCGNLAISFQYHTGTFAFSTGNYITTSIHVPAGQMVYFQVTNGNAYLINITEQKYGHL